MKKRRKKAKLVEEVERVKGISAIVTVVLAVIVIFGFRRVGDGVQRDGQFDRTVGGAVMTHNGDLYGIARLLFAEGVRQFVHGGDGENVADDEFVRRFREVIRQENETNRNQGLPVTGYDYEKKASYIEYPDGRRVYGEET